MVGGEDMQTYDNQKVAKCVGRGRGSSRPVHNNQRISGNIFKQVLAKKSLELVRHPTPQAENPRKDHVKSCFSLFFHRFVGQNPFQNLRKTRPIILNRSQPPSTIPNPLYIDFTSLNVFCKKKMFHFLKYF